MKLKKIAASVLAATVAFSTVAYSSIAEEVKSEKIALVTSELKTEIKSDLVFIEGIGVVDITGVGIASSENGNADEDANLDVSFEDIGYISGESLKAWKETGELKVEKLKADFDTTGLKWGMFNGSNGYVQLVKMEKQKVEGSDEEENVVTYRGLYKIENGEIKHLCDLDNFWTWTRVDGISVGVDYKIEDVTITEINNYKEDWDSEVNEQLITEVNVTITQPDGTKETKTVAKADLKDREFVIEYDEYWETTNVEIDKQHVLYPHISCPTSGDELYSIACEYPSIANYLSVPDGIRYTITKYFKDGTEKLIYESDLKHSEYGYDYYPDCLIDIQGFSNGSVIWYTDDNIVKEGLNPETVYAYDGETGEITVQKNEVQTNQKDEDGNNITLYLPRSIDVRQVGKNAIIAKILPSVYYNGEFDYDNPQYVLFKDIKDFLNGDYKTRYKNLEIAVEEDNLYLFETYSGKIGYMDENEKVLGEFDATDGFVGKYAPVVKDGKAYLVDKDMKAVSTEIEADDVIAIDEDLFLAKKGDTTYFVTYQNEEKEPADSSDSESSSDSETLSDNSTDNSGSDSETSSDSNSSGSGATSPDTGVAGLSLTLGVIALAGAAVVISRKKH